jgi:hypothetical protein
MAHHKARPQVKSFQHLQQVKVAIKTEVKSELKARGQRLVKRATVPPEGGATVPAAKRRRGGGAAPLGGAFCRWSRPRVPLPLVDDRQDLGVGGAAPAVDFAPGLDPTGPHPREAEWEAQLARLHAHAQGGARRLQRAELLARGAEDPSLRTWVMTQRVLKKKLDRGEPSPGVAGEWARRVSALGVVWDLEHARLAARSARPAGARPPPSPAASAASARTGRTPTRALPGVRVTAGRPGPQAAG